MHLLTGNQVRIVILKAAGRREGGEMGGGRTRGTISGREWPKKGPQKKRSRSRRRSRRAALRCPSSPGRGREGGVPPPSIVSLHFPWPVERRRERFCVFPASSVQKSRRKRRREREKSEGGRGGGGMAWGGGLRGAASERASEAEARLVQMGPMQWLPGTQAHRFCLRHIICPMTRDSPTSPPGLTLAWAPPSGPRWLSGSPPKSCRRGRRVSLPTASSAPFWPPKREGRPASAWVQLAWESGLRWEAQRRHRNQD